MLVAVLLALAAAGPSPGSDRQPLSLRQRGEGEGEGRLAQRVLSGSRPATGARCAAGLGTSAEGAQLEDRSAATDEGASTRAQEQARSRPALAEACAGPDTSRRDGEPPRAQEVARARLALDEASAGPDTGRGDGEPPHAQDVSRPLLALDEACGAGAETRRGDGTAQDEARPAPPASSEGAAPAGQDAPAAAAPAPASTATAPDFAPTVPQRIGATSAALAVSLVSLVGGIALGMLLPSAVFAASGRPSPFALAGGFLVGTGLGSAGAWYLAPQVIRLFGDTSVTRVRDSAFSVSRWAMGALGASVVTFGVGAGLEASAFGRGQGVMIGAIVAGLVSTLAVLVCETIGVAVAWQPQAR